MRFEGLSARLPPLLRGSERFFSPSAPFRMMIEGRAVLQGKLQWRAALFVDANCGIRVEIRNGQSVPSTVARDVDDLIFQVRESDGLDLRAIPQDERKLPYVGSRLFGRRLCLCSSWLCCRRSAVYHDDRRLLRLRPVIVLLWNRVISAAVKQVIPSGTSTKSSRIPEETFGDSDAPLRCRIDRSLDGIKTEPVESKELSCAKTEQPRLKYARGGIGTEEHVADRRPSRRMRHNRARRHVSRRRMRGDSTCYALCARSSRDQH